MSLWNQGWAAALSGVVLTSGCDADAETPDTDIAENLIPNPSFEVELDHWETTDSDATATRTGDEQYAGSFSVQIDCTTTTADDLGIQLTNNITVVEDDHVYGSGWFLEGDNPANVEASISFYDTADVLISTETGTPVATVAGTWVRASVDAIAPALTASVQLHLNFTGGATNGDLVGWVDAAMLTVGDSLVDYFDGDTPDTPDYGYAWDGDTNDSASSRTPCAAIYGTTILQALTDTPKGLGHPGLRTEDTTYAQRDGVTHWNDWWTPRFITLVGSLHAGHPADCNTETCMTVRSNRVLLSQAWKRQCNDIELVLYPPCEPGTDIGQRVITGPYGVVGRPRVFESDWEYRDDPAADFLLRFDCTDHRLYVLDPCGTPGLGQTYVIERQDAANVCANLPMCFDAPGFCFDQIISPAVEPTEVTIEGTECVYPTLVLFPGLTRPRLTNLTTGDWIGYNANIVDSPVIVNTELGTATQDGVDVTANLIGSLQFNMTPGDYELELVSQSDFDDGYLEFNYRPSVLVG